MSTDPTGMVTEDEKKADGARPGPNDRPGTPANEVLPQPKAQLGEKIINLLTFRGFKTDNQITAETATARGSGGSIGTIGDNGQLVPTTHGAPSGTGSGSPPPVNVTVSPSAIPPNDAALAKAQQLAIALNRNLTITSGYRPGARGAHGALEGNAFDLGHNANGPIPLADVKAAYRNVFAPGSTMAIQETSCYHFQLQPGKGGTTGFLPGL